MKWNFQWGSQDFVTYQATTHSFAQFSFFSWSLTKNNSYIVNGILCKASDLNQLYVWERGVCSDSNQTAQQLQMEVCKSLETISGMILNWLKQKFAVKWVAKWNAMAESNSETSTDCQWTSLIVNLKIFWDICHSKNPSLVLLTNHNSISKICAKFQALNSHFSEVLTAKWMTELSGQRSSTGWAGQTGQNKRRAPIGCSRCWQRQARLRKSCHHF